MKTRIAAVVAVVMLVIAISAYWLDWVGRPDAINAPPVGVEGPSKDTRATQPPVAQPTPPQPTSKSIAQQDLPPSSVNPADIAPASRPAAILTKSASKETSQPTAANALAKTADADRAPNPVSPEELAAAAVDVDKVKLMFRDYRTRMGENPTGTNAEIMKAVMGDNPKQARLGPPEGQQLNGNGELVDRWGTPYFFHQMSRNDMEIRSAGPDKQMWTGDDLVGR